MRRVFCGIVLAVSIGIMSACGGGGGVTTSTSGNNASPTAISVSGVAATGAPIYNGTITVTDVTGHTKTGTTDSAGHFNIDVTGLSPPFLAKVAFTDSTGTARSFYSYCGAAGTANINPLSNAAVAIASGTATPAFNAATQTAIKNGIAAALTTLQTKLATLLGQFGAGTANPITDAYVIGSGLDKFFDMVTLDVTGTTLTVKSNIDGSILATAPMSDPQAMTFTGSTFPAIGTDIKITAMSTTSGEVGSHLVLTGSGFDPAMANNHVLIGGVRVYPTGNAISLDVVIPPGSTGGSVVVINKFATGTLEMAFAPGFGRHHHTGKQYHNGQ